MAILIAASIAVGFLTENKNRLPKNKKGNALRNSVITSLVLFSVGFCSGFIPGLFYLDVILCIGIGLVIGLIFGLLEGYPCLNYFSLRLTLWLTGQMPWNITHFLDYCTERLILQRVGNRYRFIHRLVQEHFAKLEIQKE
ncbi:hypothetical protein ACOKW7_22050 [Limnospira platensis CENA597]|uniref:hypothetical protein n=1 Tax=Limnospira platensis TaxID=118562 RepID=UPI003D6FDF33